MKRTAVLRGTLTPERLRLPEQIRGKLLSGKFSSDRTVAEYAADIWRVKPCPVG